MPRDMIEEAMEETDLGILAAILRHAWCCETASPGDAADWSEDNPAKGQCAVTALVVQRVLGGKLLRGVVDGFGSHYRNLLPSGKVKDLTWEQFPEGTEEPEFEERDLDYVLGSPGAVAAKTLERFELLMDRCSALLHRVTRRIP